MLERTGLVSRNLVSASYARARRALLAPNFSVLGEAGR